MSKDILIKPLITEKLSAQMEDGTYAFVVRADANKIEIRNAVQARYPEVTIKHVRTINVRGKKKSQFTRRGPVTGRKASYKKALVTLTPGSEQIDFFEEV